MGTASLIKGGTPVLYGDKIDGRGMRFNVRLLAQQHRRRMHRG